MNKFPIFMIFLCLFVPFTGHSLSFEQKETLTGVIPAGAVGDAFGGVLYFADDQHLFVGAFSARPEGKAIAGAVYVYKKINREWVNSQILLTNGLSDHLGAITIKVYQDWLFISAVGTPIGPVRDEVTANQDFSGSIQIYRLDHNSGQWLFFQSIDRRTPGLEELSIVAQIPVDPPQSVEQGAGFGVSFDITHDGILLAGAATQQNSNTINSGAVYSFKFREGSWRLIQKIVNPDGFIPNDTFGGAVKIYKNLALIGTSSVFTDPRLGSNTNVYLFKYWKGQWHFVQKIHGDQINTTPLNSPALGPGIVQVGDNFGNAIAFKNGWAIISAPFENLGTCDLKGAAYLFKLKINKKGQPYLVRELKITSDDPNAILTGMSVALGDNLAVVGDPTHSGPNDEIAQGAFLIYKRKDTQWVKQSNLFDSQGGAYELMGNGVDIHKNLFAGGTGQAVAVVFIDIFFSPPLTPTIPLPVQKDKVVIWKIHD